MRTKPITRKVLPLLIGGFALSGLAHAQVSITTADGTNGADGSLQNDGNRASNFVDNGSIKCRYAPGVRMKVGYLRFDISGLAASSDNSGSTVSVEQVFGGTRTRPWRIYGLRDGNAGELLVETTISYDNAPGIIDSDANPDNGKGNEDAVDILTTLDIYDATTNPTGAWELVGETAAWGIPGVGNGPSLMPDVDLGAFIDADTNGVVTFLLISQGADNTFDLASKESGATAAAYPTLVLPNATAGDSDGDGLPNDWEIANGLDENDDGTVGETSAGLKDGPNGALGDPDSDTHSNLAEFEANSDPQNILSVPTDIDADGLLDVWEDIHFGDNSGTIEQADVIAQNGEGDPDNDKGTNEDEETAMTDPNDRASFLDNDGGSPDGQNDWWEIFYFSDTSTTTAGTDQSDADGFDNAAEYAATTDPTDSLSIPGDIDGDGMPDLWEDRYYGNNDGIVDDSVAGLAELAIADGTANTDGDAFTDFEEANSLPIGSDPFNAASVPGDSDGDNLADQWEIDNFSDVTSNNGLHDPDGDLYNNEEEETAGTDPTDNLDFVDDADTDLQNDRWEMLYFGDLTTSDSDEDDIDMDGFLNFDEYEAFSNPNNINSVPDDIDGDGLEDTFEITFFGDIYTWSGSDDPDRDYSTNAEEVVAGTDPTNRAISPDSDLDGLGDGWEMFSFGNLTTTESPLEDSDTVDGVLGSTAAPDGYDNATEYANATNGLSPLSTPDADNDGLPDGYELAIWGDITTQTGADDSDGGGASNRIEFFVGTNPDDMGVDDPSPGQISTANGNGADTFTTNDPLSSWTVVHSGEFGLQARSFPGVRQRITFLRFDISNLSGDLSNAMLQLDYTGSPATRDLNVYGLVDGDSGENWDEGTTSYSNAPGLIPGDVANDAQFARDPKKLRLLGSIHVAAGVTGIQLSDPNVLRLKSFLEEDTDGLVTLIIQGNDNNTNSFRSKEGANDIANPATAPTLVIPLGIVANPGDLAITSITRGPVAGEVHLTWSSDGRASLFTVRGAADFSTAVSTWAAEQTGIANGGATTSTTLTGQTGTTKFYVIEEE